MPYTQPPPKTKRDLVNRLTAADFDGDLRNLGQGARVSRVGPNVLELRFEGVDRTFLLSVHIPREGKAAQDEDEWAAEVPAPKAKRAARH